MATIDVTSKVTPRTYQEFRIGVDIMSLCNEDMKMLASKLSEVELVRALMIYPCIGLGEARKIALHYKGLKE